MDKTWMPTTGGILNIICGAIEIIGGLVMIIMGAVSGPLCQMAQANIPPGVITAVFVVVGVFALIFGVVALLGGIYALRRKLWGLALAGSILSVFIIWFLGVASIVFIALSKKEFE
jgi:hypothetical protein